MLLFFDASQTSKTTGLVFIILWEKLNVIFQICLFTGIKLVMLSVVMCTLTISPSSIALLDILHLLHPKTAFATSASVVWSMFTEVIYRLGLYQWRSYTYVLKLSHQIPIFLLLGINLLVHWLLVRLLSHLPCCLASALSWSAFLFFA